MKKKSTMKQTGAEKLIWVACLFAVTTSAPASLTVTHPGGLVDQVTSDPGPVASTAVVVRDASSSATPTFAFSVAFDPSDLDVPASKSFQVQPRT